VRSIPLFAELPAPAIEGLAVALTPAELPAGAILIRQGDPGDAYYGSPPVSSISSERLEVLLLPGMRGRGHQQEVPRDAAEQFAELIAAGGL
jgi:hypothetical protein